MIKQKLQLLLDEEMDRKRFLVFGGGIILAVTGVTGFINLLLKSPLLKVADTKESKYPVQVSGYGASDYGGK